MIRWERAGGESWSKTTFPPQFNSEFIDDMDSILTLCQPATFGMRGKDVQDEMYRKAGKLYAANFSTDFHPHDCRILDTVQQVLFPSTLEGPQAIGISQYGVRAELYKLNVCPTHPIMRNHSPIVCLLHSHAGGNLRVWHWGQIIDFDWGSSNLRSILTAIVHRRC